MHSCFRLFFLTRSQDVLKLGRRHTTGKRSRAAHHCCSKTSLNASNPVWKTMAAWLFIGLIHPPKARRATYALSWVGIKLSQGSSTDGSSTVKVYQVCFFISYSLCMYSNHALILIRIFVAHAQRFYFHASNYAKTPFQVIR